GLDGQRRPAPPVGGRGMALVDLRSLTGQLLAEAAGRVLALDDPALLQDRYDAVDEVLERRRSGCVGEVDAVDVGLALPALELVGDLLDRADGEGVGDRLHQILE